MRIGVLGYVRCDIRWYGLDARKASPVGFTGAIYSSIIATGCRLLAIAPPGCVVALAWDGGRGRRG